MRQLIVLAVACAGLTACATSSGSGGVPALATSAFRYTPSDTVRPAGGQFGYQLEGMTGWHGQMLFETTGGEARVNLALTDASGQVSDSELLIAMPYLDGGVRRYHGVSASGLGVAVELQAGPCRSADAGDHRPYFARVMLGDAMMTGCGAEIAALDRWSNYLPAYLPAISTCVAEFSGTIRHVSFAYTLSGGATGIRLVERGGDTWECATRDDGARVNSLRSLDAADVLLGEGDPVFVPGFMPQASDGCYVYESVREADGQLIGALGYDACDPGFDDSIG